MIDYHVHTSLCRHAEGTMEAYVRQAVCLGLKEICFLDHLTVSKYGRTLSMAPEEIPFYFQTVQSLKQRFEDAIAVKVGLEIDFNPAYTDLYQDIVGTYAFDVIGSALHFPDGFDIVRFKSDWNRGAADTDGIYGIFFEQLEKMLEFDYFDIICHMDLVKKFGRRPSKTFETEIDNILSKIKNRNLTVEVNTSGFSHPAKEAYPSPAIIKKCLEQGIHITLGSDAHAPEAVGRNFDKAMALLLSSGCNHLTVFSKRKPARIPI